MLLAAELAALFIGRGCQDDPGLFGGGSSELTSSGGGFVSQAANGFGHYARIISRIHNNI